MFYSSGLVLLLRFGASMENDMVVLVPYLQYNWSIHATVFLPGNMRSKPSESTPIVGGAQHRERQGCPC